MSDRSKISPEEASDRLSIRELIDAYAHCADRRDASGQMALFTEDMRFLVFMESRNPEPSQEIRGRENLAPVFENLKTYDATTHFNGQSTIVLNGDEAAGETYCLAHHISVANGKRSLMLASIRYLDTFTKQGRRWLFSERRLMVDWIENRVLD
jgi:ketosteroid isomerase-like protein